MIKLTPERVILAIMANPILANDLQIKTKEDLDLFFKIVINREFWPDYLKDEIYALHMRCTKCDFLDVVLQENAKQWKCPNCE
jgi:hypothetical protein